MQQKGIMGKIKITDLAVHEINDEQRRTNLIEKIKKNGVEAEIIDDGLYVNTWDESRVCNGLLFQGTT